MKVSNLLFAKYNNYANRLIKTVISDFDAAKAASDDWLFVEKVNFHQGDGINAEQVVNADFEDFPFDYLFVCDEDDDAEKITSRWFVIAKNDNRRGQVNVSLKRDLISDYLEEIVASPFMMERGNLDFGNAGTLAETRAPDPLVFLPEDQQYNQIKKAEYRLYRYPHDYNDDSYSEPAWIVGYVPKNVKGYQTVEIQELGIGTTYGRIWGIDFDDVNIKNNRSDAFNVIAMPLKDCNFWLDLGNQSFPQKKDVSIAIMTAFAAKGLVYDLQIVPYLPGMANARGGGLYWNLADIEMATFNYFTTPGPYDHVAFMEYGIYKGNYPGNAQCNHSNTEIKVVLPSDWPSGGTLEKVVFVSDTGASSINATYFWFIQDTISLKDQRLEFVDGTDYSYDSGTRTITFSNPITWNPLFDVIDQGLGHLEIVYQQGTAPQTDGKQNVIPGIVSLAKSEDEFFVEINDPVDASTEIIDTDIQEDDIKESVNTDVYRLVSPNQNGIFEWSPAANYAIARYLGDTTRRFCNWNVYKVAICLKPFDPYIRVSPDFSHEYENIAVLYKEGLYGKNFKDGRGLICHGDFSLTMPSSAWQQYQLNNKTYASTFSREITTLEKKNELAGASDAMGVIQSTAAGAVAGGLKGGVYGAIAGAAVGLTTSTFKAIQGAIARRDAIDKAKTDFNMSVQAIRARPDSISKVSALDPDNKIWPYVEVYSATEEEKDLFEERLCTIGMKAPKKTTIAAQMSGTVRYPYEPKGHGVPGEVYQFFSGTIVKMADSDMTTEMINEVNKELDSGVYFNVENF